MKKITSRRELAVRLGNGEKIKLSNVSKGLNRIITLWISRKEIKLENDFLVNA